MKGTTQHYPWGMILPLLLESTACVHVHDCCTCGVPRKGPQSPLKEAGGERGPPGPSPFSPSMLVWFTFFNMNIFVSCLTQ